MQIKQTCFRFVAHIQGFSHAAYLLTVMWQKDTEK